MSNKTLNICKLVLLLICLALLCAVGYRMVKGGRPNIALFESGKSLYAESFDGVSAVDVNVRSCAVRVYTHSGEDTRVDVRRSGLSFRDAKLPTVEMRDGTLSVAQAQRLDLFAGDYIVEISVPEDSRLEYELRTDSGSLRLYAPSDKARVASVSGSIRVRGAVDARLESVSGSIRVYGDEAETIHAESTSGSIKLEAGENAKSIYAQSTSGSIKLSIPEDVGYTLDYRSMSGSVKDELRGVTYEKHGTVTQGDAQVDIIARSTSGSIKITDQD